MKTMYGKGGSLRGFTFFGSILGGLVLFLYFKKNKD